MNHEGLFISALGTETTDDIDPSVYPGNEEWLVYLARSENVSIIFTNLSGTCEYVFGTSERFVTGIDFSPDGDKLAVTVEDELLVVDFENLFGESAADLISACEGQN